MQTLNTIPGIKIGTEVFDQQEHVLKKWNGSAWVPSEASPVDVLGLHASYVTRIKVQGEYDGAPIELRVLKSNLGMPGLATVYVQKHRNGAWIELSKQQFRDLVEEITA